MRVRQSSKWHRGWIHADILDVKGLEPRCGVFPTAPLHGQIVSENNHWKHAVTSVLED